MVRSSKEIGGNSGIGGTDGGVDGERCSSLGGELSRKGCHGGLPLESNVVYWGDAERITVSSWRGEAAGLGVHGTRGDIRLARDAGMAASCPSTMEVPLEDKSEESPGRSLTSIGRRGMGGGESSGDFRFLMVSVAVAFDPVLDRAWDLSSASDIWCIVSHLASSGTFVGGERIASSAIASSAVLISARSNVSLSSSVTKVVLLCELSR